MTDEELIAALRMRANAFTEWGDDEQLCSAVERLESLSKENFALAANQCSAGYSDEYGNHRCRHEDTALTASRAQSVTDAASLISRWRSGEFENSADAEAQDKADAMSNGEHVDASLIIEAWLTALPEAAQLPARPVVPEGSGSQIEDGGVS